MLVGMGSYSFFTFVNLKSVPSFFANADGELHFLHGYFISFVAAVGVMLFIGWIRPRSELEIASSQVSVKSPVDMTPWSHAKTASWAIMGITVLIYIFLSGISG
jgi:uncharacterized sodium:solute symporter family permease YidK